MGPGNVLTREGRSGTEQPPPKDKVSTGTMPLPWLTLSVPGLAALLLPPYSMAKPPRTSRELMGPFDPMMSSCESIMAPFRRSTLTMASRWLERLGADTSKVSLPWEEPPAGGVRLRTDESE